MNCSHSYPPTAPATSATNDSLHTQQSGSRHIHLWPDLGFHHPRRHNQHPRPDRHMDIWLERHPAVHTVRHELRRIRYERAQEAIRERQEFLTELRQAMQRKTPYRDTRPQPKRKYVRRLRSVSDFTAKQTRLAERILYDLALHQERESGRTKP